MGKVLMYHFMHVICIVLKGHSKEAIYIESYNDCGHKYVGSFVDLFGEHCIADVYSQH